MGRPSGASSEYAEKAVRMLEAARFDLESEMFDKAVSAAYFAVEAALNSLSVSRQGTVPSGFRSRLRLVERWFGEEFRREYALLHHARVKADHGRSLTSREAAEDALRVAEGLVSSLLRAPGGPGSG